MHETDTPAVDPYRASLRRSRERRAAAERRRRWRFRKRGVITGLAVTMTLGGGAALAAGGGVSSHHSSAAGLLRSGSNGSTVAALQRALGISADGVYGPQTRRAVRAFQAAHGLIVDGIAGPQTLGALGLASAASAPASAAGSPAPAAGTGGSGTLARIAACESGGNPHAISADGQYRGKYQFTRATWQAVGGHGDPAAAPAAEQDRRAAILLAERGTSPWPRCGR
jgi:peptidoglycan hydrolase-like protein with peptidoglycan-binding domain